MTDAIPINDQTWLICGGRDFADAEMFNSAMGDLVRLKGMPGYVLQGGAPGADAMALAWAGHHGLTNSLVRDAGRTEIPPDTPTCIAVLGAPGGGQFDEWQLY